MASLGTIKSAALTGIPLTVREGAFAPTQTAADNSAELTAANAKIAALEAALAEKVAAEEAAKEPAKSKAKGVKATDVPDAD